ncbi:helix-turn-helix domain-containing protein [Moraxella bovis]|uniref:helix-turn-helix domain-containing protein n=1 Tax=Moraxella bovis TaxID=476 RepID=UPI0022264C38|nr:helix-turn-helix transcriptional regulator [Moraxella bovis]UYZ68947.1 helix-turn-helix domain-containing protein [Moraxella bovis]UYZ71320.1 helix-turn-helix domain-containing protein [Moraxella bovis]UYZ72766.1 helix-turn-helix domain-containing protein [Moraxella bovis]UZA14614.1 helix-turn-helix domain-containing protein [Moraxella bovis]UZA27023.1 helix-turn-helix domain-containing protein [Moraxella bovis]
MTQIGKTLKRLRALKGFTQEHMAEKLHMTTDGYAQIERDVGNPNLPKIEKIAKIFDMTTVEFLDFCENGATFYISGDAQQNNNTDSKLSMYYLFGKNGHETLLAELEKSELTIQHKDELLEQKQNEINALKEIIELLKTK